MTPKEAAEILRINPITLKRRIRNGEMEAIKVKPSAGRGGHWRWEITDENITNFLKQYESQ